MTTHIDVERMDSQTFESVLKKLPNITRIEITVKSEATERVFEVLMKSYKHLKTIHVRFLTRADDSIVDRLLRTYGSQLTRIWISSGMINVFKLYTNSYTKLTQLSANVLLGLNNIELNDIFNESKQLLVNGLLEFGCNYNGHLNDLQQLKAFVSHYENCLKTLDISIQSMKPEGYINVMKELLGLKALRVLKLRLNSYIHIAVHEMVIDYHCDEFVTQWPQLKRYELEITYQKVENLRQVFESVNRMRGLKILRLTFKPQDKGSKSCYDLSLNSLSGLKRLQHLWLDFGGLLLNQSFFDDIHTYYPRLTTLRVSAKLESSTGIKESVGWLPKLLFFRFQTKTNGSIRRQTARKTIHSQSH